MFAKNLRCGSASGYDVVMMGRIVITRARADCSTCSSSPSTTTAAGRDTRIACGAWSCLSWPREQALLVSSQPVHLTTSRKGAVNRIATKGKSKHIDQRRRSRACCAKIRSIDDVNHHKPVAALNLSEASPEKSSRNSKPHQLIKSVANETYSATNPSPRPQDNASLLQCDSLLAYTNAAWQEYRRHLHGRPSTILFI